MYTEEDLVRLRLALSRIELKPPVRLDLLFEDEDEDEKGKQQLGGEKTGGGKSTSGVSSPEGDSQMQKEDALMEEIDQEIAAACSPSRDGSGEEFEESPLLSPQAPPTPPP